MVVKERNVRKIENAIRELEPNELAELMGWLEDYQAKVWDQRIEEDLRSGRLDAVLAEADQEYEAGLAKSL